MAQHHPLTLLDNQLTIAQKLFHLQPLCLPHVYRYSGYFRPHLTTEHVHLKSKRKAGVELQINKDLHFKNKHLNRQKKGIAVRLLLYHRNIVHILCDPRSNQPIRSFFSLYACGFCSHWADLGQIDSYLRDVSRIGHRSILSLWIAPSYLFTALTHFIMCDPR